MKAPCFFGVLTAFLAATSVACAPAPTTRTTTTTAADVSSVAAPAAPAPAPTETPATASDGETAAAAKALPGQLVCRIKSAVDGTTEVYLEWTGGEATGTVRREVPSGMVYVQRVRAERADSLIIVDEPSNEDLMTHVAVIGRQDGKPFMRVGEASQRWTACE